jgi:hypothetical protein
VQNSHYQQSLAIFKRLADQDKSNSGWQRDLIVSLYKVGPVRAKIKGSDNIKQAQGLLRTGLKTAASLMNFPSQAGAGCTIEPLPPHPPLPPGGFSGGNSFGMQSGRNASFGLLPGGADF